MGELLEIATQLIDVRTRLMSETSVSVWACGDPAKLSRKLFGLELAERFVEALQYKSAYTRAHQGYCGWIAGFAPKRQEFIFIRSWEGYIGIEPNDQLKLVWSLPQ